MEIRVDSNLLVTKIIVPTRRADVLRRPRLLDFIHDYVDRKLLLVSASAGYGKTSLLVDFAHDTALPVCWYTLDERDQDPQVFLAYLVASIQRRFPHFGARSAAVLRRVDGNPSLDAFIGALITDIQEQIDSFFVIVLDDYQLVENSEPVNQLLDRLLTHLPENAHIILASRTIPAQLTLTRLTARQQVAGLGMNDLRFISEEIRALMRQNFGLEITPVVANDLAAQSEGWIAGIVLTTPTLWRGLFQEWVKGYGPGSQLFEYLAAEVLAEQPHDLQQFLLETAVLNQFDAALSNELLGRKDAQALLDLAERRNLFITRLGEEGYRYHPLFREFLHERMRQTQATRYAELMRRAALRYERHGKLDQAIEYWLAAGESASAARLLEVVAEEYYDLGRWTTLTRWLDGLAEPVLHATPSLLLVRAILMAESGAIDAAQPLFEAARDEFEARGDVVSHARALIQSARYEQDPANARVKCQRAIALLPRHEYLGQALGYRTLGIMLSRQGDWAGSIPLLERATELYETANNRYLQSDAETELGTAYWVTGDRGRGQAHFENALRHRRQLDHPAKLANILNSIAVARYQAGDLKGATELLEEGLRHARESGNLRTEAYVLASLGDVYRDEARLGEALQSYTQAAAIAETLREGYLTTYTRIAVAEVWRLGGDLSTAEQVLQTALNAASAHRSDFEVALVQLAFAALRLADSSPDEAVRHLERALPALEHAQAKREIARANFFLAHAAFVRRQERKVIRHLRALAAIGKALDEDQFLWCDASRARDLIDFAITRRVGGTYFQHLDARLAQRPHLESSPLTPIESAWPQLEVFTLGNARVVQDGVPVPRSVWQTATTSELFFFFATNPQAWRKEQVIEQLWANSARGQANDLFHSSVYRIRRALFPECLVFRNGLYQLNPEIVRWWDVAEFERILALATRSDRLETKVEHLERAVELYRGDFLDEVYSDWCAPRREELRSQFLEALLELGQLWAQLGDHERALDSFLQVLRRDPLHERTYRELIVLYASRGNRTAAIQTYQQCVQVLRSELGVPPMAETIALYERFLKQES
jgi:ATP/maltotriose-dependent transcriptional regulator MalT/DNA-binding SARP family transcriptional activator